MYDNQFKTFESKDKLAHEFANDVAKILSDAVRQQGYATLVVSGGSTPKPFFHALRDKDLPWEHITITLADERFVPVSSDDSTEKLVREHLLHKDAKFISLAPENTSETVGQGAHRLNEELSHLPSLFDVVVLGMGDDGHTASLFPNHPDLKDGLESKAMCIAVRKSPKPPAERISLTASAIMDAKHLFLHITGDKKREVYQTAETSNDANAYPISAFINQPERPLVTYWAA